MALFWKSPASNWAHFHSLYEEALAAKDAANNSKHSLPDLDKFVWAELPAKIKARDQHHMTADEYMKLILWKTQRGQSRPTLIGYAKQLSDSDIVKASTDAFKVLDTPKSSLSAFTVLKGCGPATASAALGALDHSYPYMSDELLMAVVGDRKYTPTVYFNLHKAVAEKVAELTKDSKDASIEWTAREVERAVFANAMLPNKAVGGASTPVKAAAEDKPATPSGRGRGRRSTGGEDAANKTDGTAAAAEAKPAAAASEEATIEKEVKPSAPGEPVKRGRGRPRKIRPDGEEPAKATATPGSAGPKRGRGRPRKNPETAVASAASGEQKTPRKRGRPRKNPEKPKQEGAATPTTPKRGRGRPRKNPEASPPAKAETPTSGVKRGRGRPRKNPVEGTAEEGQGSAKRAKK